MLQLRSKKRDKRVLDKFSFLWSLNDSSIILFTDTKDLIQCLVFLLISFDKVLPDKLEQIFEAVNQIENMDRFSSKELSREIICSIHQKLFPKSSANLHEQYSLHLSYDETEILRLIANLEQPYQILKSDANLQIDYEKMKIIVQRFQRPKRKYLLEVQSTIANQLYGDDFVSIVHILPHLEEADLVFGHLAGNPLTVPQELKENDQKIKKPPLAGLWNVVCIRKVSLSKKKQLKKLGFNVIEMMDYGNDGSFSKKDVIRMVADSVAGTSHGPEGPPPGPISLG